MMEKLQLAPGNKTVKEMRQEIKLQLNDWEEKLEDEKEKEERKKREGKELKAGEKGPKGKKKEKKDEMKDEKKGKKKQSSDNKRGPWDEGLSDVHTLVFLFLNFWLH
jgi:hypothetical protein